VISAIAAHNFASCDYSIWLSLSVAIKKHSKTDPVATQVSGTTISLTLKLNTLSL
jgi:hypothetical protein